MAQTSPVAKLEVEIKTRLADRIAFTVKLEALGFQLKTPETPERNVLFDTADGQLRRSGELLRVRRYGERWKLTHKAPAGPNTGKLHKSRVETETEVTDGEALASIFEHQGYRPIFTYEKIRAEWTDGQGEIVVDRTPIGDFAELEGSPEWIDATAARLGIQPAEYVTASYAQLFLDWKKSSGHAAQNMTFAEIGKGDAMGADPSRS